MLSDQALKEFKEIWAKDKVFFENYQGYISTQLGPQAEIEDLKKLAEEIKRAENGGTRFTCETSRFRTENLLK